MKKIALTGMVLAILTNTTLACNICGGAGGASYLGVLPQYQKHFLGLRYQNRSFQTTHPPSIIPGMSGRTSIERYSSFEVSGRYCPGKRWQILGFSQFQFMEQKVDNIQIKKHGFGDPITLGYYSVLPGIPKNNLKLIHLLQAGIGIKLPLGRYEKIAEGSEFNPLFQIGTGSWDKLFSAIYSMKTAKNGMIIDATYTLNGVNNSGYHFGSRINSTLRIFHLKKHNKSTWMGNAGLYGEIGAMDKTYGKIQNYTGGSILMPSAGIDYFTQQFSIGFNFRIPVWQNLGEGYIKSKGRLLFNVSYLL